MFVDACAIVSLIAEENTASAYEVALASTKAPFTSPLAAWEAVIVLSRKDQLDCRYSEAEGAVVEWLDARGIEIRDGGDPRLVLHLAVAVANGMGSDGDTSAILTVSTTRGQRRQSSRC